MGGALSTREWVPLVAKNISEVREGGIVRGTCGNKLLEISLGLMRPELLLKHNNNSSLTAAGDLIVPKQIRDPVGHSSVLGHYRDSSHPISSLS